MTNPMARPKNWLPPLELALVGLPSPSDNTCVVLRFEAAQFRTTKQSMKV